MYPELWAQAKQIGMLVWISLKLLVMFDAEVRGKGASQGILISDMCVYTHCHCWCKLPEAR